MERKKGGGKQGSERSRHLQTQQDHQCKRASCSPGKLPSAHFNKKIGHLTSQQALPPAGTCPSPAEPATVPLIHKSRMYPVKQVKELWAESASFQCLRVLCIQVPRSMSSVSGVSPTATLEQVAIFCFLLQSFLRLSSMLTLSLEQGFKNRPGRLLSL